MLNDIRNETIKEYINPDNKDAEVRVRFDEGKVFIRDSNHDEVTLTEAQGRWLGTELDTQFGGGGGGLDHERLVLFTGSVNEENIKNVYSWNGHPRIRSNSRHCLLNGKHITSGM